MTSRDEPSRPPRRAVGRLLLPLCVFAASGLPTSLSPLRAQSIEPRNYSNAPIGSSFFIAGFAATSG